MTASETMTWRRFLILLQGLSGESALAMSMQEEEDEQEFETDKQAEQAMYSMLGVKVGD